MKRMIVFLFALVLCGTAFALEPEHTGSWYDPDNSGYGITLHAWEDGAVFWFFSHGPAGNLWLMSDVSDAGLFTMYWPNSNQFPVGQLHMQEVGWATLTPVDDTLVIKWNLVIDCGLQASPVPPWCGISIDSIGGAQLFRLTPE